MVRRWSNLSTTFLSLNKLIDNTLIITRQLVFKKPLSSIDINSDHKLHEINFFKNRAKFWLRLSYLSRSATLSMLNSFRYDFVRYSNSISTRFIEFTSNSNFNLLPTPNLISFYASPSSGSFIFFSNLDMKILRQRGLKTLSLQLNLTKLTTSGWLGFTNFTLELLNFSFKSSKFKVSSLTPTLVAVFRGRVWTSSHINLFRVGGINGGPNLVLNSDFFLKQRSPASIQRKAGVLNTPSPTHLTQFGIRFCIVNFTTIRLILTRLVYYSLANLN